MSVAESTSSRYLTEQDLVAIQANKKPKLAIVVVDIFIAFIAKLNMNGEWNNDYLIPMLRDIDVALSNYDPGLKVIKLRQQIKSILTPPSVEKQYKVESKINNGIVNKSRTELIDQLLDSGMLLEASQHISLLEGSQKQQYNIRYRELHLQFVKKAKLYEKLYKRLFKLNKRFFKLERSQSNPFKNVKPLLDSGQIFKAFNSIAGKLKIKKIVEKSILMTSVTTTNSLSTTTSSAARTEESKEAKEQKAKDSLDS